MDYKLYEHESIMEMEKAIEHYRVNLSKIVAGRANPQLLNNVKVLYYETSTPLNELASISVPEPRQLLIKPFDHAITRDVVYAINNSSLNITAVNEGAQVRITFPELTTERRKELVKLLTNYTEQARIQIRNIRHDINKAIKDDEELSEDDLKRYLEGIQKIVDRFNLQIEEITKLKEKELLTI